MLPKDDFRKTVQRFNGSVEQNVLPSPLPQAALDILGVLGSNGVAGEAVAVAGVAKSDVSYWAKRFILAGALVLRESTTPQTLGMPKRDQRVGPGLPKYYDLTPYGSKILTGSEAEVLRLPVVFEDHPVKFGVLRWEALGSIDWEKLGQPRNWNKFGFRVTGVRVEKTPKNVIIHPGPLKGFDVDVLEVDSGRIIERVRYILEVKFGMQLSEDCEFLHKPMWQVFRPEAKQWIQAGSVKVDGIGALDESPKPAKGGVKDPLSKTAHVEFNEKRHAAIAAAWPPVASDLQKQLATDAPMYPLYLEDVHRMVANQAGVLDAVMAKLENLDKICESLTQVTNVLGKLLNLEGDSTPRGDIKGNKDGQDYVR